ncbi:MAG: helix-turn-helix domain-containing protein [Microcystis sp. M60BS1]|uniref:helix-turn-helix domain-containing protein n=1 Tax=unclassified Microcystis TaxID=2643300 RepID=UPI00257F6C6C|nr:MULTISPECIES: helix-turn-helix domain-containing protein [unclassified Microcystis]MCA2594405.1 helix-turn-helix domain-containing protein [Microcystis sp. M38BS1]MCA6581470.1 helix-turn-helix domain-containing protein [Pseudanabaena sp. M34BS1SP1A06MG]MCA2510524.1 helix-turn-helix domain-containing protein [Microcystis sp. M60BS1]MCA2555758.1 helix-turn-helix domain-containing protein [Microcystis sp. M43BS1]MCA2603413.1 helix-turn-helix domain-containing protein [Microcystis sp. M26BS1]
MRKNKPTDVFKLIDMSGGKDACWPFTGRPNSEGRPYIQIDGKKVLAYRLVYELVKGVSLGNQLIRHTCDNGLCCNPFHHIPGNHDENMEDMKQRERHGLPHHAVRAIRQLGNSGLTHKIIAERYGVSETTVRDIINKRNYSHVQDNNEDEQ